MKTDKYILKQDIRDIPNKEVIRKVRKDKNSEFSVFLAIELKNRFENRPREEKHMNFEQWRKILILRDKNGELIETNQSIFERMQREAKRRAERISTPIRKNKMYYSEKDIIIPNFLKTLSTKQLLNLRYDNYVDVEKEQIYAELANRSHIPTNKDQRNEQKKRGPSKKDGEKKKSIRSFKSQTGGKSRR